MDEGAPPQRILLSPAPMTVRRREEGAGKLSDPEDQGTCFEIGSSRHDSDAVSVKS